MSYNKVICILPNDLIKKVQEYIDGEFIYIPRKSSNKKEWGARTSIRQELYKRNTQIYGDYLAGHSSQDLSGKYTKDNKGTKK
ncbi:hypothetical protein G9F71_025810 [Clostridium sp. FP2]|uniref:CD3324 family protein n=1 Tax=Clostridium sp. FP2 TaxID=2724481 RepID=UPI0013E99892|nr:CD3324 family protein [Clostridium sp. FP2]MBZ9626224.1 hypothetical protein [Clostridium sp. FP2]